MVKDYIYFGTIFIIKHNEIIYAGDAKEIPDNLLFEKVKNVCSRDGLVLSV